MSQLPTPVPTPSAEAPKAKEFHPNFAKPLGPGTVILETKDDTLFYARLPLLAEVSPVFRDMAIVGKDSLGSDAECRAAGGQDHEYPRIPLPEATRAGLTLVLTIIRDTLQGRRPSEIAAPSETFVEALEIALMYDIQMLRRAVPRIARTLYAHDPWGYLAILAICQDDDKASFTNMTLNRFHAPSMPTWARDVIRKHDPDLLLSIMERQLGLYASRNVLLKGVIEERGRNTSASSCIRKKCAADLQALIAETLQMVEDFAERATLPLHLISPDEFIPATSCQQCRAAVRGRLWPLLYQYEKMRNPRAASDAHLQGLRGW